MPSINPLSEQEKERLAAARLAMSEPTDISKWQNRENNLIKRKQEAAKAMVSDEQAAKLAEEANKKKERLAAQKKLEQLELERKTREEENKKVAAEKEKIENEIALKEKEEKIKRIMEAKREIGNLSKETGSDIRTLRTYGDDLSATLRRDKISASKIIIQEKAKRLREEQGNIEKTEGKQKGLIAIIAIGLVFAGLGLLTFIYFQKTKENTTAIAELPAPIIFSSDNLEIDTTGLSPEQVIARLVEITPQPETTVKNLDKILNVSVVERVTAIQGKEAIETKRLVAAQKMAAWLNVPESAAIFFADRFMLGIFKINNGSFPFYIFKTNDYKRLANAMLENENEIFNALFQPFSNHEVSLGNQFKDRTLKNMDLRILTDDKGDTAGLYSFTSSDTLIFAPNEVIFGKILNAL